LAIAFFDARADRIVLRSQAQSLMATESQRDWLPIGERTDCLGHVGRLSAGVGILQVPDVSHVALM
jgi:hypothetical protein